MRDFFRAFTVIITLYLRVVHSLCDFSFRNAKTDKWKDSERERAKWSEKWKITVFFKQFKFILIGYSLWFFEIVVVQLGNWCVTHDTVHCKVFWHRVHNSITTAQLSPIFGVYFMYICMAYIKEEHFSSFCFNARWFMTS